MSLAVFWLPAYPVTTECSLFLPQDESHSFIFRSVRSTISAIMLVSTPREV